MEVQVILRNIGDKPLTNVVDGIKTRGNKGFPFTIRGPNGALSPRGEPDPVYALRITTLNSGEFLRFRYLLNQKAWGISQPGKYYITFYYPFGQLIESNQLEVTIR
jgi:hypothetical protein